MKPISNFIIIIAGLTVQISTADNFRSFYDPTGREIEACLRNYTPKTKTVKIELKNGKVRTANISAFSEDDIAFIKEWHWSNTLLSSSKLGLTVGKKSIDSGELFRFKGGWSGYDPGLRFKDIAYDIKISNNSGTDLSNLRIEYCIYKESVIDETVHEIEYRADLNGTVPLSTKKLPRRTEISSIHDTAKIASLTNKEKYEHTTKTLQIRNGQAGKEDAKRTQRNVQKLNEDLLGIRVRMYLTMESGNQIMKEFSFPSDLQKKTEWSVQSNENMTSESEH